ncbi:hypothetical protein P4H94_06100 [Paenibacillus macerans]|uniref:REase associating with pPIWI RE domain-containing protein n=1 Tax=Paenibacillus macerans TaxID=44252 RepID=A0A6N8F382_PAEMA|nr:hypothetical protein [Paenibacillus macerans]MEC0136457.1 hypothetical protein [Paenibacillus macerans]MUG25198.1 hypothetical protein [Paenibacillus macerans]UMV47325.1 hypothetical protein LMZ02_28370 [Paenibacillus macerans]
MVNEGKIKPSDMLFHLITGIQKWQNNFGVIPDELYKGMLMFIQLSSELNTDPPVDLYHLMQILHKPSQEWGISDLKNDYPEQAPLLDKFVGLVADTDEFLNRFISPQDAEQQHMYDILKYCRDESRSLQAEYTMIRSFLSDPEHAVIAARELSQFVDAFQDPDLVNLIRSCYQEVTKDLSNYRKCPHCGWTMEYRNDRWRCNKEDVCHLLVDMEVLEPFLFGKQRVFRLTPGIQRFVLLPGMSELRMAERLRKKGYEVDLYPNIDTFDLSVKQNGHEFFLDVKDFKDPQTLANYFNDQSASYLEKYLDQCFIVVPQYRDLLFRDYKKRSQMHLNDTAKQYIRIIMENEVDQRLQEVFF